MPTTRPRHSITETGDIAEALADAARRWPEDAGSPSRLLLRLLRAGHEVLRREQEAERRRAAVEATSGLLTGIYPQGYLAELRTDWDR